MTNTTDKGVQPLSADDCRHSGWRIPWAFMPKWRALKEERHQVIDLATTVAVSREEWETVNHEVKRLRDAVAEMKYARVAVNGGSTWASSLKQGRFVEAVKIYRSERGSSLKEAHDAMESARAQGEKA